MFNISEDIFTLDPTLIESTFDYLLAYLKLYGTLQYKLYMGVYSEDGSVLTADSLVHSKLTMENKIEILREIFDKELYLIYNANEEESPYDILNRLETSKEFKLNIPDVYIKDSKGEFVKLQSRTIIGPIYTVLLNKTTDDFLGASSFFLNAYGFSTGKAKEDGRYPYKYKNVKSAGESEIRSMAANATPKAIQLLADRSRSIVNHRKFYRNQLRQGNTNAENLVFDREENADMAINLVQAILEPAGITIDEKVH